MRSYTATLRCDQGNYHFLAGNSQVNETAEFIYVPHLVQKEHFVLTMLLTLKVTG